MAQVYDEPIVVRLTVPVGSYPVGTEFGFKDVADAIRALGSSAYFEVVRTQDGDPIPPPTPEDMTEAEKQALARARAARLIRGADFDPLVPGPGEVIVGGADGPVATTVESIGAGAMGVSNITPETTAKWRRAVARVRAGTADAKVLCVGDSTTWGLTTTDPKRDAYPSVLTRTLNAHYAPAVPGLVCPPVDGTDSRWNAGTGWVLNTPFGFGFALKGSYFAPTGTTAPLTFTPGITCDTFDVYYLQNAATGTLTLSIDGGTATVRNTAGVLGWNKVTVTAPLGSTHVLTITPSGNGVAVLGIDAHDSTAATIRIGNAGISGSKTSQWIEPKSLPGIGAYAPDLTALMLGINDSRLAPVATAEQYLANLRAIITEAKKSGDVLLMSFVRSGQAEPVPTVQASYQAELPGLAKEMGCVFLDIGDRFGTFAQANALGLMSDTWHPNALGAADIAAAVYAALTQV